MSGKDPSEIINDFLLNAPPGEYEQCSAALKAIVENDDLINNGRASTIKKWFEKECQPVEIGGKLAIICEDACQDDGSYIDPLNSTTFHYDFDTHQVTPGSPIPTSEFVKSIQLKLMDYIKGSYKDKCACGAYEKSNGTIVIILRGSHVSLKNFRSGHVISRYEVNDNKITGKLSLLLHYFEDGNAFCENSAKLDKEIKPKNVDEIIKRIQQFENSWLSEFTDSIKTVGEECITKLRRKFPVSKTKINWQQELTIGGGMKR